MKLGVSICTKVYLFDELGVSIHRIDTIFVHFLCDLNKKGSRRDFLCLAKYHRQPVKEEVYVHDTM